MSKSPSRLPDEEIVRMVQSGKIESFSINGEIVSKKTAQLRGLFL